MASGKRRKNYRLQRFIGRVVGTVLSYRFGFSMSADERVVAWKKENRPFVILSAHPSELDAAVLLAASWPNKTRFVVGAQQLYRGMSGRFLRLMDVIPKRQFVPDIGAVKEMMQAIDDGYILGFMPEGRVSMDGTPGSFELSTAKLLKKLAVPVAVLVPHGSYFSKPPYNRDTVFHGKLEAELNYLFSENDIASLSTEEIMQWIAVALSYNACEELRGSGLRYKHSGKRLMQDVSRLFYRCPVCGSLYTISDDGKKISCSSCGASGVLSSEGFIGADRELPQFPDTIAAWNQTQLEFEKEFWAAPDAELVFEVKKSVMKLEKGAAYKPVGSGRLYLSREKLSYIGTGENFERPISQLPGISADYLFGYISIYDGNIVNRFFFDDIRHAARVVNSIKILNS